MRKQRSFTLIELLVVIAIVSMLASFIIVGTKSARDKAKRTAVLQFTAQVHHALGADAVGIWDFDEGTGTPASDSSGYNNNGSCSGDSCPIWKCASDDKENTPSGQGCSLEFDGTDHYVNCGNKTSLDFGIDDFSIGFWIKTSSNSWSTILAKGLGSWAIVDKKSININLTNTGKVEYVIDDGIDTTVRRAVTISINDNKWHYLVFVFDRDGDGLIYLDGSYNTKQSISAIGDITNTNPLIIGSREGGYYFLGLLDEVRIYNQVLSSARIQKLYVEGLGRHQSLAKTE